MPVRRLRDDERLKVARGDAVVCIPVYGAVGDFARCLASVLEHTAADVPVLVCDDHSPGAEVERHLDALSATGSLERTLLYARRARNLGFVGNVNAAFEKAAPADVVVVNSDVIVGPGWLDGLRAAAYQDETVATASTLTNHGTIVSLPRRNMPSAALPEDVDAAEAARRVRDGVAPTHPRLPTAIGHCVYVRRAALELVGPFDLAFSPGYGEEVDFSQRCVLVGLKHVLADDVFVYHRGAGSFGGAHPVQEEHERTIAARYPYYHPWVRALSAERSGPFPRALAAGRRALTGLSITIDGTSLNEDVAGTQVQTMAVIRAIVAAGARPRVVVPPQIGQHWRVELERIEAVSVVSPDEAVARDPTNVVHRPFQVLSNAQLEFLHKLGERIVVTHQDLIAFHNPGYHDSFGEWHAYRTATARTMAVADAVVFISQHGASEALAEELVEERQVRIVPNGTDHETFGDTAEPRPPAGFDPDGGPFLLCLGVDFKHKNRVFALELFDELRRGGWDGRLVLAGPRAAHGSSAAEERAWLITHADAAARVTVLPAVSEGEKTWLYGAAALVLYPTVQEGFGLVPFEAARAGVPCLFAAQTSLAEILPPDAARIVQWNASLTAPRALELIADEEARRAQIATILAAGERFTWARTGELLMDVYRQVVDAPTRPARALLMQDAAEERKPWPAELERALVAVAERPRLRRPLFGSVRAGLRAARGLRRLTGARR
jgi:glycosyltransferase involved in cell wall biosynthesis